MDDMLGVGCLGWIIVRRLASKGAIRIHGTLRIMAIKFEYSVLFSDIFASRRIPLMATIRIRVAEWYFRHLALYSNPLRIVDIIIRIRVE